jgi:biotin carboxylase
MVEAAGLKFIGPSSGPMLAMGDKINSKIIAKKVSLKSESHFIDYLEF